MLFPAEDKKKINYEEVLIFYNSYAFFFIQNLLIWLVKCKNGLYHGYNIDFLVKLETNVKSFSRVHILNQHGKIYF